MMEILAHRGLWQKPEERNGIEALRLALISGFGVETDVRDSLGELVISHDIPLGNEKAFEELLKLYAEIKAGGTLAINIKSDGIQEKIMLLLKNYDVQNFFLFDMSVPETVTSKNKGFPYYTRRSDIEGECVLLDGAKGVWLDSFYSFSLPNLNEVEGFLEAGKEVCFVSPELHQKNKEELWNWIKEKELYIEKKVKLCTDNPKEAREYFNG